MYLICTGHQIYLLLFRTVKKAAQNIFNQISQFSNYFYSVLILTVYCVTEVTAERNTIWVNDQFSITFLIHKVGDKSNCSNSWGICFISFIQNVPSTFLALVTPFVIKITVIRNVNLTLITPLFKIWGSHGCKYKNYHLLECDTIEGTCRWRLCFSLKFRKPSFKLQSITSQETVMFMVSYWSDCLHSTGMRSKWEYDGLVYQLHTDFRKSYNSVRKEVLCNILI